MLGARVWLCRSLLLPRAGPGLATSCRYRRASGLLRRACACGYPGPGIRALVLNPCPAHTPSYLTPLTPLVCSWHLTVTLSCRSLLLFPPLWLQG